MFLFDYTSLCIMYITHKTVILFWMIMWCLNYCLWCSTQYAYLFDFFPYSLFRRRRDFCCDQSHSWLLRNFLQKKASSFYDSQFEVSKKIALMVKWNNSIVTVISRHYYVEPIKNAKSYEKKTRKREQPIQKPDVISMYNKYMGDRFTW